MSEKFKNMPPAMIAYIAGIFEKAHFNFTKGTEDRNLTVNIRVVVETEVRDFLETYLGFKAHQGSKNTYTVYFSSKDGLEFNEVIQPYLLQRKRQSEIFSEFKKLYDSAASQKTNPKAHNFYSDENIKAQYALNDKLVLLNAARSDKTKTIKSFVFKQGTKYTRALRKPEETGAFEFKD